MIRINDKENLFLTIDSDGFCNYKFNNKHVNIKNLVPIVSVDTSITIKIKTIGNATARLIN